MQTSVCPVRMLDPVLVWPGFDAGGRVMLFVASEEVLR